ncbi:hypothetical protein LOTGIDRAFT_236428 [Lottia gigantea]|uniref:Integrator complex subunit 5 C-terminal domain-containing protein n=1 Tax=Lottia gigantea TaxID=225164 RepID=V3YZW7_LOTGI|nr:hypothetical protein LOTGIDRAFT_236428 [Lottia gigantea]ESO83763.1 hypothetical protein LOTGIDRAFT_236428 [Lottia gigantea]
MATAMESAPAPLQPKDILNEVNNFLHGARRDEKVASESLAKSALCLLRSMPAARHAVLEHFCNVFNEAVRRHLSELDQQGSSTMTTEEGDNLETILNDIVGVLLSFIKTNPDAWAPIISSWSLELLGHLSSKYSEKRVLVHVNSLNEVLQLWMTCKPTKLLMELATECFAAMVAGAPDSCVDSLLEGSVKYSPHFDWVVAHIGSCFPKTIITRVLNCGLKDFCNLDNQHPDRPISPKHRTPKMASVVGILGHLASNHGNDIRQALMKLFQESLISENDVVKVTTVPFLLQLASMSTMLLQVLTTDIIAALTPNVLNILTNQFANWKRSNSQEYFSFLTMVIHLVMKSDVGGFDVLNFLISTAIPHIKSVEMVGDLPCRDVQETCVYIMNQLLNELRRFVYSKKRGDQSANQLPLFAGLKDDIDRFLTLILESPTERLPWLQKLLLYICVYIGESNTAVVLAKIVAMATSPLQLGIFANLRYQLELSYPNIIARVCTNFIDLMQPHKPLNFKRLVQNILHLIKLEKKSHRKNSSQFSNSLHEYFPALSNLLLHQDYNVSEIVLQLITLIEIPRDTPSSHLAQLCGAVIFSFFKALQQKEHRDELKNVRHCKQCIKQLTKHSFTQCMLVRFLMEGAVNQEYSYLLGARPSPETKPSTAEMTSLLQENRLHGTSLTLSRSHSSVFHAGIIGQGLKKRENITMLPKEHATRNVQLFIEVLWLCCLEVKIADNDNCHLLDEATHQPNSPEPTWRRDVGDITARNIGCNLVELITLDVLYNDLLWPDEEFNKVTIERDLYVWKNMEKNPVFWSIFEAFCSYPIFIYHCSPVLKSIAAVLMLHYSSFREKSMKNSPKHYSAACRLVHYLGRSGILPAPLSHIGELFPFVTPYEGYLLITAMWRYIKENPLTYMKEEINSRKCSEKYTEVIASIIHSNIDKMGHLYSCFFSIPS